ncbi:MAG: CPBP family intramembrane metalloprotease [Sphingobacteriales bacterium JAD_PAG50586_3]|nr:MAG: CPBP family intramembrane metalloprotease [Sphingobacteriales bacterium JAD_PAG50586_3]
MVNVDVSEELELANKTSYKSYLIAGLLIVAALPLINLMLWLNMQVDFPALLGEFGTAIKEMEDMNTGLGKMLLPEPGDVKTLLLVIVVLGITPAICEELVFRGVFQRILTASFKNGHAGVWAAAFIFSAIHFQFYGFLPRLVLGAVLGYLFMYSRTLWVPMLGHAVNNTLSVLASYFQLNESETLNTDTLGTSASDWLIIVVSIVITVGLFIVFKKINKDIPQEPENTDNSALSA